VAGMQMGEVSELADERDLGSRGATRESSSLSFPTNGVMAYSLSSDRL
jgi:hypothetical protein